MRPNLRIFITTEPPCQKYCWASRHVVIENWVTFSYTCGSIRPRQLLRVTRPHVKGETDLSGKDNVSEMCEQDVLIHMFIERNRNKHYNCSDNLFSIWLWACSLKHRSYQSSLCSQFHSNVIHYIIKHSFYDWIKIIKQNYIHKQIDNLFKIDTYCKWRFLQYTIYIGTWTYRHSYSLFFPTFIHTWIQS